MFIRSVFTPNLIAVALFLAPGSSANAARKGVAVARVEAYVEYCALALSAPEIAINRARLGSIFAEDAVVHGRAVGFVGLTKEDLVDLATMGGVPSTITRYEPHLVERHPSIRAHRRTSRFREYGFDREEEPWDLAVRDARSRVYARILAERVPAADPVRDKLTPLFNAFEIKNTKVPTFSPRFRQIVGAVETAKIWSDRAAERWPHVLGLTRKLGLPRVYVDDERSPARLQMVEIFANLPTRAGFVVALSESALGNTVWSAENLPFLRTLLIDDIIGIEPMSNSDYDFIDAWTKQPAHAY